MMNIFFNYVKNYTQDIIEANAIFAQQYEIQPGIYSNVDPATLIDCNCADIDINR